MSQPTLNSSLSGINSFNFSMHRGSGGGRLSYTSLRATSGDNSINEEERLSTPNVHALGGSGSPRGSLTMERSSSRLSQPDIRRFALRHDKRERLSQPTLVTGDYYPGRTQQRLSQPCLSSGIGMHSPSPPPYPLKHKRFGPAILQVSQRDRLSQLDIGAKYRNIKDLGGSAAQVKFNRDRFSIPELETQNDLRLIAGTPKQRFSLDSQLTKQRFSLDSQDSCKSRLLPIASSPIFEHQQMKTEELMGLTSDRLKSPTCEGLQSVIVASTSPIFPPGERRFLAPDFPFTGRKPSKSPSPPKSEIIPFGKTGRGGKPPPIPMRERMSVPEIRNSSLRRLLDPPVRQRHSIAGNLRQSLLSPVKLPEFSISASSRKSPRYSIDDALEKLKRIEKEENRRNQETSENKEQEDKEQDQQQQQEKEPKHIQRHYSYTYETPGSDESGSVSTLGKLSVGGTPKRKFLESNFDENEQVITTVIETEIPMILPSTPGKYAKKAQAYSSETPKWIRKYLENENSPKVGRKPSVGNQQIIRSNRRSSRRKSSLESIETMTKKPEEKIRSKSASCEERTKDITEQKGVRETYVRIVPSNNAQQENRYEVGVETTATSWTKTDSKGLYGDDTDTDDSTSI
ncbi:PREDICTED: uncharacterized protein LOC105620290 [Atta cephalotes]|uniref:Uncharacterized protein n=1 Tax=Atta cephalotes TaxID=12957 RepID=A0A158NI25_ATTCE|nr:PREDICTED: uncharacterized protein LOC105620290 [Atta cephalotes]